MEKPHSEQQLADAFNHTIQKLLMDIHFFRQAKESDHDDFQIIENILHQYTFENRLEMKGLITRTIVDSLDLEYSLSEKLIWFDSSIR